MVVGTSSLESFKEFQKITSEVKGLRSDYKSIDSHLTAKEAKLDHTEPTMTQLEG